MKPLPILLLLIVVGCTKDEPSTTPVAKGSRKVGMHITQAELNSYDTEFQRSKAIGIEVFPLSLPWNLIETNQGFDYTYIDLLTAYYAPQQVSVSLNLTPIYAVNRALPADIADRAFNDPVVITRFKALVDSIKHRAPKAPINNFVVGLEVDDYLNGHTSEWSAYNIFYDSAITYLRKQWPGIPVGVETTWVSAVSVSKKEILSLNTHSDMMVLSYYPNQTDFTVKSPTIVSSDIQQVIDLYPNMPVFIIETGYQTSAACNSTDEKQRQFVEQMFKLWDTKKDRINFIGFLWLTDLSSADVDQYVIDYGLGNIPALAAFKGYLQTTGLRTYKGSGADKPGFTQLKSELKIRGW